MTNYTNQNPSSTLFKKSKSPLIKYIGKYIDSGSEGDVYEFNKNQIIKIGSGYPFFSWKKLQEKFSKVSKMNPKYVAKCYSYGILLKEGSNRYYYYISEKLKPLSKEEIKAMEYMLLLMGMSEIIDWNYQCDKEADNPKFFGEKSKVKLKTALKSKINKKCYDAIKMFDELKHKDLGVHNIMKDRYNRFKVIDYESFE